MNAPLAVCAAAFCGLLAACDDCDDTPCDFEAYLSQLAGDGAELCEDAECAQAALEAGRPMIYRYAEHPNFSFAYVFVGDDAPPAAETAPPQRYYDVSFGKLGGDIAQRTCAGLEVDESSPEGLECVGGAMLDGSPEYPDRVCSKEQCGLPAA